MESIAPKERFYPCPYCNTLISSDIAECEKCGLEVSGDGIDEIVKSNELKELFNNDALSLRTIAVYFAIILIPTYYLIIKNNGIGLYFIEFSCILFGIFIWKLIKWRENLLIVEQKELIKDAQEMKNKALLLFVISFGTFILFLLSKF